MLGDGFSFFLEGGNSLFGLSGSGGLVFLLFLGVPANRCKVIA